MIKADNTPDKSNKECSKKAHWVRSALNGAGKRAPSCRVLITAMGIEEEVRTQMAEDLWPAQAPEGVIGRVFTMRFLSVQNPLGETLTFYGYSNGSKAASF